MSEFLYVIKCSDGALLGWWDNPDDAANWAVEHPEETGDYVVLSLVKVTE